MKRLIGSFLIFGFTFLYGQNFEKFSDSENHLIWLDARKNLPVIQKTNPQDSLILKTVSKLIDPKDWGTKILAEKMLDAVTLEGGVGIAAPQVGINRRMVWVQRFDKEEMPFELFINPEIIWASELLQKGPEGDLSFEERGMVMRSYIVQVRYQNLEGEALTEMLEGFTAVIFQHERDHLDGILLTDRIQEQKSILYKSVSESSDLYFEKD